MTTPIKPEDIPDEMDEICEGMLYKRDIADILNTAIELGVVSPAVYLIRRRNNRNVVGVALGVEDQVRAEAFMPSTVAEHWKGQEK